MQARLLDATIDCLVDVGWARTSLPEVVNRAGVGRGAQVHHFPTKASLIAAAGEHLIDRHRAEFAAAFSALAPEDRTIEAALDVLWSILHGRTWRAVMELAIAARTDPVVAGAFADFTERVDAVVLDVVGEHFPALLAQPFGTSVVRGAVALLVGLTVQGATRADPGNQEQVFNDFKLLCNVLSQSIPGFAGPPGGSP
jgi:AcrR family transcriptional regulator